MPEAGKECASAGGPTATDEATTRSAIISAIARGPQRSWYPMPSTPTGASLLEIIATSQLRPLSPPRAAAAAMQMHLKFRSHCSSAGSPSA
jgi:hypothetical protein